MAQLHRLHRSTETSKSPRAQTSPTFGQLLQEDSPKKLSQRQVHEEDSNHHKQKSSVLAKVKEKAKKLKHSLSGKKKHDHEIHDHNNTFSRGFSLRGAEKGEKHDADPEYFGAPMYESEQAPMTYKASASREKVDLTENSVSLGNPISPINGLTETESLSLKPIGLTVKVSKEEESGYSSDSGERWVEASEEFSDDTPRMWDMKEYLKQKVEPGEDEKALSQVITEAMSPRKSPKDISMVEKMKDVVTSYIWPEETCQILTKNLSPSSHMRSSSFSVAKRSPALNSKFPISNSANSSPRVPISSNASEVVEEQNHGRILQSN